MIKTTAKPAKPSPDFPLFPHQSGKWCKKVAGKPYYFGRWDDPHGALLEYETRFGGSTRPTKLAPQRPKGNHVPAVTADYPLYPHATGRWCKRIKGKLYYFGKLDDPGAALAKYKRQKNDLENGRRPAATNVAGELTLLGLKEQFIATKKLLWEQGRLERQTLNQYVHVAVELVEFFGPSRAVTSLCPQDFEALVAWLPTSPRRSGKKWSLVTFSNFVRRAKVMFNYAVDDDVQLISQPVRFGKVFAIPKKRDLRVERQGKPKKFFTVEEIKALLGQASLNMRAMILLGVNCGFGNRDCGDLPTEIYDPSSEWLDYSRGKTGISRRCPLWIETRRAIQEAWNHRRDPLPGHEQYLFISRYGRGWYHNGPSAISTAFRKLAIKCKIKLNGRGFYSLRHVFQTIGEESKEKVAVSHIMGHYAGKDMADVYREFISDARLKTVTSYVHDWLYG